MQQFHPHKNAQNRTNQRGNAIMIILVMIALLAALTAVAMRSSSRTANNMEVEQARIQAEKLMRTAKAYETATQQLIVVNHCSENQLNLANTTTTRNYTNATAPTDKHCNYFNLKGVGQAYNNPASITSDTTKSALSDYGQWVFTGTQCILGVGSDDDSTCSNNELALIMVAPHIDLTICLQINTLNGITNPSNAPPVESFNDEASTFKGSFAVIGNAEIGSPATELVGHATGCFEAADGAWAGSYIFYHVLLAR
jgi:type II secretory pathway pseudopilin PulG